MCHISSMAWQPRTTRYAKNKENEVIVARTRYRRKITFFFSFCVLPHMYVGSMFLMIRLH